MLMNEIRIMHANTKMFIDGIVGTENGKLLVEIIRDRGAEPKLLADALAASLDEDCSMLGPFTRQEELCIAAELRAGLADHYIAGILGYT